MNQGKRKAWTELEDERFKTLHALHGNHWRTISRFMAGRTNIELANRWKRLHDPDSKVVPWTREDDDLLVSLGRTYGRSWKTIEQLGLMPSRSWGQMRTRYYTLKRKSREKKIEEEAIVLPSSEVLFEPFDPQLEPELFVF
jgi:Myb-like DNA-binding protein